MCLDRVFSSNRPNSVFHSQSGKTTIFCDCQGNAKIQRVVRVGVVPWCFQDRQHEYVSPASGHTFDALFARKLPKADGSPSETYAISKQFMALVHFYSACATDASATHRRNQRHVYDDNLALYSAWEEKDID